MARSPPGEASLRYLLQGRKEIRAGYSQLAKLSAQTAQAQEGRKYQLAKLSVDVMTSLSGYDSMRTPENLLRVLALHACEVERLLNAARDAGCNIPNDLFFEVQHASSPKYAVEREELAMETPECLAIVTQQAYRLRLLIEEQVATKLAKQKQSGHGVKKARLTTSDS